MKILVTGSAGQLGHQLMLLSEHCSDKYIFTSGCQDCHDGDMLELDVTDREAVDAIMSQQIDVLINCAAYTDVNGAESHEEDAYKVNATAPQILAEAAKRNNVLMIHISTDYVFDGSSNVPYTEEDVPSPAGVYAKSKYEGDKAVMASGCRYMIFRTSWMYGLSGRNFFLTIAEKSAENAELKVVCDQLGTPTPASGLAFLIHHIIENRMLDKVGLYNYSGEGVCSWYDFAHRIVAELGYTCRVLPCRSEDYPSPVARPHYSVLDNTKVKNTFNIDIPHWTDALAMTVLDYQKDN